MEKNIELYYREVKKMIREATVHDGKYVDEYYMGKLLD